MTTDIIEFKRKHLTAKLIEEHGVDKAKSDAISLLAFNKKKLLAVNKRALHLEQLVKTWQAVLDEINSNHL